MNQDLLIKLEKAAEKLVLDIPAPLDCPEYTALFNEKFAELIVRECMDLVKDCYAEPGRSLYQSVCASTIIEEHFGVEE